MDTQHLSAVVRRHCQRLCLLAVHPSSLWTRGYGWGRSGGILNFHYPDTSRHPSRQPHTVSGRRDLLLSVHSSP